MKSGRFAENTFNSGETVEIIRVETRNYQFLYREGNNFIFMDAETYDQIYVDQTFVGDGAKFLKENQDLQIVFDGDDVMQVLMPAHVNLRITNTEPGLKGDTATNASKPATVETGTEIKVPLFVNEGDLIRLDTKNGAYIERVKE
jgi:elongation factor P